MSEHEKDIKHHNRFKLKKDHRKRIEGWLSGSADDYKWIELVSNVSKTTAVCYFIFTLQKVMLLKQPGLQFNIESWGIIEFREIGKFWNIMHIMEFQKKKPWKI